jgi:hypothetical protein
MVVVMFLYVCLALRRNNRPTNIDETTGRICQDLSSEQIDGNEDGLNLHQNYKSPQQKKSHWRLMPMTSLTATAKGEASGELEQKGGSFAQQ